MLFPAKSFHEMTAEDYVSIGFKGGLEVHQQLLTSRKLFCRCPAGCYSHAYDAEILRHMRPTLSELGEYDGTALMEKKTRKNIFYRINRETVCTYEFDDTPPFFMDDEALDIAVEIAMLLNLNLVDELHVARKQYLDGSIPTGFQRTAIVGVTGSLPYAGRKIGVTQLSIEEDSCREVTDAGHDRVLLTDRLGMPLIETVTDPDMRTPQEIADVCWLIAHLGRATGRVRRGYGAAREDVNVSVRGGTRIEIKGVPQIWRIPRLAYNEARRQCALLDIRAILQQRGVTPETFKYSTHDVTHIVSKARYEPISVAVGQGMRVKCVVLPGFGGLLNTTTQEHTTFAREFSDRVRVIACLTNLPNIVHSDTATESLAARDWKQLYKKTRASTADALVLVWGDEKDTHTACEEIAIRAREATEGVPNDTRQALKDGTTGFERVLPGAERMYPDTDLPPLELKTERLDRIRALAPCDVWDRLNRIERLKIPRDARSVIATPPMWDVFDRVTTELKVEARFVATVLGPRMKALRRRGLDVDRIGCDEYFDVFMALADGQIAREGVLMTLEWLAASEVADESRVPLAIETLGLHPLGAADLEQRIESHLKKTNRSHFPTVVQLARYLTGVVMAEVAGCVEGRRVAERVTAALNDDQTVDSVTKADA